MEGLCKDLLTSIHLANDKEEEKPLKSTKAKSGNGYYYPNIC